MSINSEILDTMEVAATRLQVTLKRPCAQATFPLATTLRFVPNFVALNELPEGEAYLFVHVSTRDFT